jgi:hypothetical protein
MLPNTLSRK